MATIPNVKTCDIELSVHVGNVGSTSSSSGWEVNVAGAISAKATLTAAANDAVPIVSQGEVGTLTVTIGSATVVLYAVAAGPSVQVPIDPGDPVMYSYTFAATEGAGTEWTQAALFAGSANTFPVVGATYDWT
jgi:hypothetical protein